MTDRYRSSPGLVRKPMLPTAGTPCPRSGAASDKMLGHTSLHCSITHHSARLSCVTSVCHS
jgi:hypothetical protein